MVSAYGSQVSGGIRYSNVCRASAQPRRVACSAVQLDDAGTSTTTKSKVLKFGNTGTEFVIDENPELKTNMSHRAIVYGGAAFTAALLLQGLSHSTSPAVAAASLLGGYIFADIGSGIYHWSVDNYGSAATPVVGSQIAAFQGHHQRPWTITQREFCNNVSLTFKPAGTAAALLLVPSVLGWTSAAWDTFAASSIFFIAMSQQFHAWSHMKKSQLPDAIVKLQDANLLISRKAHGAHHRSPFNANYCIVSGWCNPILDSGIMHQVEKFIAAKYGVEPRCWSEPSEEWAEQTPPDLA